MLRSLSSQGERVLEVCHSRRLLSPIAESRVRHLCQRGLSLEQALVGTGLLAAEQYGDVLSQLTGLPFAGELTRNEVGEELLAEEMRRAHRLHPLFQEGQDLSVGFADPESAESIGEVRRLLRKAGINLRAFVILQGEWQHLYPSSESSVFRLGTWIRERLRSERAQSASTLTFVHQSSALHLFYDGQKESDVMQEIPFPEAIFPALRLYIQRVQHQGEWSLDAQASTHEMVRMIRQPGMSIHHALHVMQDLDTGDASTPSLSFIIDGDHYAQQYLAQTRSADLWQSSWYAQPATFSEAEEVMHAVLSGSSGVALVSSSLFDETLSLWHALHEAGIPLRVIRVHRLTSGDMAWESLPFRV